MISTDKELIYADLTYKVRGAMFNVYNTLGFGHKEQVYQKALEEELRLQNIPYKKQENLSVKYKNVLVGKYIPDLTIDDKIILELKSVEFMPKTFEEQLVYYLKTTGYKLGLLVNFGSSRLQIKRLIWSA